MKNYKRLSSIYLVFLVLSFLSSSCGLNVSQGQQIELEQTIGIFLAVDEKHYLPMSQNEIDNLLDSAELSIPECISFSNRKITAQLDEIEWQNLDSSKTTAQGAIIEIAGDVKIHSDCHEGSHSIILKLPALVLLGDATQTVPKFQSNPMSMPIPGLMISGSYWIPIIEFVIHENQWQAVSINFIRIVIGVAILIGTFVIMAYLSSLFDTR